MATVDRTVCPVCGGYKHRQSSVCRSCRVKSLARKAKYVNRKCKHCGNEFRVHKSQIVSPRHGRFCSKACSNAGQPRRKKEVFGAQCENCRKKITRRHSEAKKNRSGLWFCGSECWYSFNQGSNHYLWKGGQNERMCPQSRPWRRGVLARDGNRCRFCGGTKNLEAHHIRPFRSHRELRWSIDNGITLCEPCHRLMQNCEMDHFRTLELMVQVKPKWK